ncbi:MAG: zinc ribbon domain-containing protein [Candidatus Izimaplasma sp.]|nr:zinc ribbon domain-containing protein [Candidatus Izimaplasma bacterium]
MWLLYIILFCLLLSIAYLIGNLCQDIVLKKGYNEKKYFWFGFVFGVFGIIIAAASPDLNIQETLAQLNRKINVSELEIGKNKSKKNIAINRGLKHNDSKSNLHTQGNDNLNAKFQLIKINEKTYCPNCGSQQSIDRTICSDCGLKFVN